VDEAFLARALTALYGTDVLDAAFAVALGGPGESGKLVAGELSKMLTHPFLAALRAYALTGSTSQMIWDVRVHVDSVAQKLEAGDNLVAKVGELMLREPLTPARVAAFRVVFLRAEMKEGASPEERLAARERVDAGLSLAKGQPLEMLTAQQWRFLHEVAPLLYETHARATREAVAEAILEAAK
jgi:hypothetical protein